jgi:hypothetical protein
MMTQCYELMAIASTVNFTTVLKMRLSGLIKLVGFFNSMYVLVNFRDVKPVYLPVIWDHKPREKKMPKQIECNFCKDSESVKHLFSECIVARNLWDDIIDVFKIEINFFEDVASRWLCNNFSLISFPLKFCGEFGIVEIAKFLMEQPGLI